MFLLLLIAIPIIEIAVAIWVASEIGWLNTIGLLILLSIIGLWVVKRQGSGIVTTLQETAQRREMPTKSLMDRFLILFGGVLLGDPRIRHRGDGVCCSSCRRCVRGSARHRGDAGREEDVDGHGGRSALSPASCRMSTPREVRRDRQPPPSPPPSPSRDREPLTWSKSVMRPP